MVSVFEHNNKTILVVDYSQAKGDELIAVFDEATKLVFERDLYVYSLTVWNEKSYVSPNYLNHIKKELPRIDFRIKKQAIMGVSTVQKWILKSVNMWYGEKIRLVNSKEEALRYFDEE
jgi:hypothetical protein